MRREKKVDVVVALAFGKRNLGKGIDLSIGSSNKEIAKIAWEKSKEGKIPMILQKEVTYFLPNELENERIVISEHRTPGKYLDTFEVIDQAKEIMEEKEWRVPVLICHPSHLWRSLRVFWKMGFKEVVTPESSELKQIPFDSESSQIWTRNKMIWWIREIPARFLYKIKGWI